MGAKLYDLNIERSVLSTLIFEPTTFFELDEEIDATYFYHPFHCDLFQALAHLHDRNTPVDELFVRNELQKRGVFDEAGFLEVLSANPIANIAEYVAELSFLRLRRRFFELSTHIKKEIQEAPDPEGLIDSIEKGLFDIASGMTNKSTKPVASALDEAMDHIERMQSRQDGLIGVDTGYSVLNAKTSGFGRGDLVVLAARPSMGKTSLALNIMLETAKRGNGVIFFSLEMPSDQLAMRLLSSESGVPLENIRRGKLSEGQGRAVESARRTISELNIVIDDQSVVSVSQIRTRLRKEILRNPGIKMAIVDYLQLMGSPNVKERHLQIAEISRGLKLLARELQIPIVALSQLNRQLESRVDKRPMLSDLRESGSIEQDADLILFVYRDDVYRAQEEKRKEKEMKAKGMQYVSTYSEKPISSTELIIGKQRNGPLGTIMLDFVKNTATFKEKSMTVVEFE